MTREVEVLREVELGSAHQPTGFTRHYSDGALLSRPTALRIVRYPTDSGVLLIYLDASGEEQTDTWHESVEDALEQARLEFGVVPEEWSTPSG